MLLLAINNIFSGKLVAALCWMLVHSLWIGLVLTMVTGIIILCTKRQTAALRYSLLSGALLLFIIGVGIVFVQQLSTVEITHATANTVVAVSDGTSQEITIAESKTGYMVRVTNFFNQHAALIVWCWFLMIAFRCILFAGGLYKVHQMKTTRLTPVSDYWNQKLQQLSDALHIRSNIQLVQSGIATIPMVVGHFKPVILFPLGLLTSLPAEEVEAVLLHELAHIRRKDYMVNLLQHFAEILFFFNPAVLWVSALIKTERENCCDDIAVAKAGSKRNYINALVSFQEYHLNAPQYAPAFAHHNKHLLQRVKRILYNNNKTLNAMEKTFLTVCLAATASLAVFFTQPTTAQTRDTAAGAVNNDNISSTANRHYILTDFKNDSTVSIAEKINGVNYTLYILKSKGLPNEIYDGIARFKVNDKNIPEPDWGKYKTIIDQLRTDYRNSQTTEANTTNEKLSAEQLELLAQKDKLNAAMQQRNTEDKLKAEQLEQLAQSEKLIAEMDIQHHAGDKLNAEQAELLAQRVQLMAKMQQLNNHDKLKAEQMELLAQQKKLNAATQQLQNRDKLTLEQLELLSRTQHEKFSADQQQLLDAYKAAQDKVNAAQQEQILMNADKLRAEQEQSLLLNDYKLKAEESAKEAALQKQMAELDKKESSLRIEEEKRQIEIDKQKQKAAVRQKRSEVKKEKAEKREVRKDEKTENEKQESKEDAKNEQHVEN